MEHPKIIMSFTLKQKEQLSIEIKVPSPFSLVSTAKISGWEELAPFKLADGLLTTILRLPSTGNISSVWIKQKSEDRLRLTLAFPKTPKCEEVEDAKNQISACLRLDEDYSDFYEICSKHPHYNWAKKLAAGRILRAPTVFEDTVKTICTTNCSWAFSITMACNLCSFLGKNNRFGTVGFAFPTPNEVFRAGEPKLREIKMGYRSRYIYELAKRIFNGDLNLEGMRKENSQTDGLLLNLRSIRGLGPYGVAYMLNFLGKFEYLTIDRWMRKRYFMKYTKGDIVSDKEIEKRYEKFGKWKGLFFWVDMTRVWLGS
jgi:3-methyladenine DNA glycosylase/8-oxoguanine DNA glycosylase